MVIKPLSALLNAHRDGALIQRLGHGVFKIRPLPLWNYLQCQTSANAHVPEDTHVLWIRWIGKLVPVLFQQK